MLKPYKIIKRRYYEDWNSNTMKVGYFKAEGEWADGHLAYSRYEENGDPIEEEQGAYVQMRSLNGYLYMQRI